MVDEFREDMKKKPTEVEELRKKLKELAGTRDRLDKSIKAARNRFHKRKLSEDSFREIVRDYEKQLIEVEVELDSIQKKLGENSKG